MPRVSVAKEPVCGPALSCIWFPVRLSGEMVPCHFLKGLFLFMCMLFHLCECMLGLCVVARRSQKKTLNPLELELRMDASHPDLSAGNLTLVLWKPGSTLQAVEPSYTVTLPQSSITLRCSPACSLFPRGTQILDKNSSPSHEVLFLETS